MGHPTGQARLERCAQIGAHIEKSPAGSAAQPFQHSTNEEIDLQLPDIHRDNTNGLICVQHDHGAHCMRFFNDRFRILEVCALEKNVGDRDKQGSFIDRIQELLRIDRDPILRRNERQLTPMRFRPVAIKIEHGGKVHFLTDNVLPPLSHSFFLEARKDDSLHQRDVRMHRDLAASGTDQGGDRIPCADRHLPPFIRPGLDSLR